MNTNNSDRENISLEQTLSFIKYLNKNQPFDKEELMVPTHDIQKTEKQKPLEQIPQEKNKKQKVDPTNDEDIAKKINKNRAIKRIIQSAFQILQNFDNYEEETTQEVNDKSSEIQFNIYLKQFNRVLEMIYKLQKNKIKSEEEKAERRQEFLQNIYQYTVVEDFREILPVAILKDKISKQNIQIMIQSLTNNLVVLKPGELRVYSSTEQTSSFKTFKLHQIQNVDYHTQPHIFIVLTILKDKEYFNVYMQFQSEKNQEKWDRALYCCYIGKKMKTKEKFFLIEYPQEDVKKKEKEQTKKQAAFHYEFDHKAGKKPLQIIFNEGKIPSEKQKSSSSVKGRNQMGLNSKDREQEGSPNDAKHSSTARAIHDTRTLKFTENDSQFNRQELQRTKTKDDNFKERHHTADDIERNKQTTPATPGDKFFGLTDRQNSKTHIYGGGTFNTIKEKDIKEDPEQTHPYFAETQFKDPKQLQELPDDIKKIHDIERKNVKGFVLQKQRFFFNKSKIVFLKEGDNAVQKEEQEGKNKIINPKSQKQAIKQRQLQYWDFDVDSGSKTERKIIKAITIKTCQILQQKLLKIVHEKQLSLVGNIEHLRQIQSWIMLVKAASIQKVQPQPIKE